MIHRSYFSNIQNSIKEGKKVIIIYGPRQAGKTTLAKRIIEDSGYKTLEINADQNKYINVFSSRDLDLMKQYVTGYDLLFLDEAQRIPDIGLNLKILHDQIPELRIIATGSSSFELANSVKEPLTGRTQTFNLYPVGLYELAEQQTFIEVDSQLDNFLRFGMYPELFSRETAEAKTELLTDLASAYLYKDILELTSIRHSSKIVQLLQLLAFQIGSEVSMDELGKNLGMSKDTVSSYIDLLEKSFVLFRLSGFSRNLRKEVSKMDKIYFWDIGIRNAVIDDYKPMHMRQDKGAIWENYLIAERMKAIQFSRARGKSFFWRTYDRQEIDYIEEKDGVLKAFEMKLKGKKKKIPLAFAKAYQGVAFHMIDRKSYWDFIRLKM
jgi:predicted AAA+ superfamily ATPase